MKEHTPETADSHNATPPDKSGAAHETGAPVTAIQEVFLGAVTTESDLPEQDVIDRISQDLEQVTVPLSDSDQKGVGEQLKDMVSFRTQRERIHTYFQEAKEYLRGMHLDTYFDTADRLTREYGLDAKQQRLGMYKALLVNQLFVRQISSIGLSTLFASFVRPDAFEGIRTLAQQTSGSKAYDSGKGTAGTIALEYPKAAAFDITHEAKRIVSPLQSFVSSVFPESGFALRHKQALTSNLEGEFHEGGFKDLLARNFIAQDRKGALRSLFVLSILLRYPSDRLGTWAGEQMIGEFRDVQKKVNRRIADSLVMRDFEFIHDKPLAEIVQTVELGKGAIFRVLRTHHMDIVPRLAATGMLLSSQALSSPWLFGLNILRMPVLLLSSDKVTRELMQNRQADMKQVVEINTKIKSTLENLEVVKTSGASETFSEELQGHYQKRDDIFFDTFKREQETQKKHHDVNLWFDRGGPFVRAAMEFLTGRKDRALQMFFQDKGFNQATEAQIVGIVNTLRSTIQQDLMYIKRFEELLGPYDELDTPTGPKERERTPVSALPNLDISIRNLSYKHILQDVQLDIPQGSFVTIRGPSGSGKTTLLRNMLGLYPHREGAVTYGGVDVANIKKYGKESIYSRLAYANQNPQYFETMTLRDNLLLWTSRDTPEEELRQVLQDLQLSSLIPRLDSTIKHYSGGELRRIGIARALLKNPATLFLDEPTANLDVKSADTVLSVIRTLREKRPDMTIVAVTHDRNFEQVAERMIDIQEVSHHPTKDISYVGQGKPS